MSAVHGLGCRASTVARVEQRAVERFDLLVAQATDGDPSERGEHVQLQVALIAPVGAGGQVQLLGREPLVGQVGAEGQGPHRVDAALLGRGQRGSEPLSLGPVGAGRMPPPNLLAGDRVPALVDHRVEPAAPLGHVSVHDVLLHHMSPDGRDLEEQSVDGQPAARAASCSTSECAGRAS